MPSLGDDGQAAFLFFFCHDFPCGSVVLEVPLAPMFAFFFSLFFVDWGLTTPPLMPDWED